MTTVNAVNTYIVPTTAYEVTMPSQPAFAAFLDTQQNNVTGDGTTYTIVFNDDSTGEFFDQSSDYNTGTGQFIAPVAGKYFFSSTILLSGIAAAHTAATLLFNVAGAGWNADVKNGFNCAEAGGNLSLTGNIFVELAATNAVYVQVLVNNGALVVDVNAGNQTRFSGLLVV